MPLQRRARSCEDMCLRCTALVVRHDGCGCATVRTHCPIDPVYRVACFLPLLRKHKESHMKGARECLVRVVAEEHAGAQLLDAVKLVGSERCQPEAREGNKQAELRPHPHHRRSTHSIADNDVETAGVARAEASCDFPVFLTTSALNAISTPAPHDGQGNAWDMRALSHVPYHNLILTDFCCLQKTPDIGNNHAYCLIKEAGVPRLSRACPGVLMLGYSDFQHHVERGTAFRRLS